MPKSEQRVRMSGRDILGKRVLLLGEAGAGKTRLASKLLQDLLVVLDPEKVTVIDFAPEKVDEIGGKLTDYINVSKGVKYASPRKVYAPRVMGTSSEQILHYAELNRRVMKPILQTFVHNPTQVLFINDVTLYLQAGDLKEILKCVRVAQTFLATAYQGSKLTKDLGTGISSRERELTDQLATFMDLIVRIN